MKRFKTKQEFIAEFGEKWRSKFLYGWHDKGGMDYLFGCVFNGNDCEVIPEKYAKYLTDVNNWGISDDMLTKKPHPYSQGKWQIEIPAGMNDKAQAKALACGFIWASRCEWFKAFSEKYLIINNGIMFQDSLPNQLKTPLTFDQFMEGYVPEIAKSKKRVEETAEKEQKYFCLYQDKALEGIIMWFTVGGSTAKIQVSIDGIDAYLRDGYTLITFDEFETRFKPVNELEKYEGKSFMFGKKGWVYKCHIIKGRIYAGGVIIDEIKTEAQYINLYELLTGKQFREEDLK